MHIRQSFACSLVVHLPMGSFQGPGAQTQDEHGTKPKTVLCQCCGSLAAVVGHLPGKENSTNMSRQWLKASKTTQPGKMT